jgi:hypothetical protein
MKIKVEAVDDIDECLCGLDEFNPQGELITGEDAQTILNEGALTHEEELDSGDYRYYQWEIEGWMDGISDVDNKMEKLIRNGKFKCVVDTEDCDEDEHESADVDVALCIRLWGRNNAKYALAYLRGESAGFSPKEIVKNGWDTMEELQGVDPFDTHKEKFKHNVDLWKHDDSDWGTLGERNYDYATFDSHVSSDSKCSADIYTFFTTYFKKSTVLASATKNDHIYMKPDSAKYAFVHEMGHVVGDLVDEYQVDHCWAVDALDWMAGACDVGPNCVGDPESSYGDYGEHDIRGCKINDYSYRPSQNSVMRKPSADKRFNVIGCGHCLKDILGGSYSMSYYYEKCCEEMDVIKPSSGCPTGSTTSSTSSTSTTSTTMPVYY